MYFVISAWSFLMECIASLQSAKPTLVARSVLAPAHVYLAWHWLGESLPASPSISRGGISLVIVISLHLMVQAQAFNSFQLRIGTSAVGEYPSGFVAREEKSGVLSMRAHAVSHSSIHCFQPVILSRKAKILQLPLEEPQLPTAGTYISSVSPSLCVLLRCAPIVAKQCTADNMFQKCT